MPKRESPIAAARREVCEISASTDPVLVALRREEAREETAVQVQASGDEPRLTSHVEKWDRIRAEAETLGEGMMGCLRWVESRAVTHKGYPPLDPWWAWHFSEFYASGKLMDLACVGLRGAKSHSNCYAIIAEALFRQRTLLPGLVGVVPVIAQKKYEANDRLNTLKVLLGACGIPDISGKRGANVDVIGGFEGGGAAGGGVLALRDSQGHEIEFRVSTASISGTAGFTGISGFCDEVDLWGQGESVNPADQVISALAVRYTTQPGAVYHVASATYPDQRPSCFDALVAKGDTPLQRVARLGEEGAKLDHAMRLALAAKLGSTDPLLLAPPDPMATSIPAWVTNPVFDIERCYALSEGGLTKMFQYYGAREGKRAGGGVARHGDFTGLAEANARLNGRCQGQTWPDLPSWDPRSTSYGQRDKRRRTL